MQDEFSETIKKYESAISILIEENKKLKKETTELKQNRSESTFFNNERAEMRSREHSTSQIGQLEKKGDENNEIELFKIESKKHQQLYIEEINKHIKREVEVEAKYKQLKELFDAEKKSRDEERQKHSGELVKLREENKSLRIEIKEKETIELRQNRDKKGDESNESEKRRSDVNKSNFLEFKNSVMELYSEEITRFMKREFDLRVKYDKLKELYNVEKKRLNELNKEYEREKKSREEEREKYSCELAKLKEENKSLGIEMEEKDDILALKERDLIKASKQNEALIQHCKILQDLTIRIHSINSDF